MRRREFLSLLAGSAAWPLAARAQQPALPRRIGVLYNLAEQRSGGTGPQPRLSCRGCRAIGLDRGPQRRRSSYRWGAGDAERLPEIRGRTGCARAGCDRRGDQCAGWRPCSRQPRTMPIVFVAGDRPGRLGPGRRAWRGREAMLTGFTIFEYANWREMAGVAQGDRTARDARGGPA